MGKLKVRLIIFLLCIASGFARAQTGWIKGLVLDDSNKDPVTGANIFDINDNSFVTTTDVNGTYQLQLPAGKRVLVCSFVGMVTDTIRAFIDSAQVVTYNVIMQSNARNLEVVVVSAGKYEQKLEDITVSMEVIRPELIESKNATNVISVLDQTPGLNILDEEPQIRGGSGFSFGVGSRVATLIDGIPIQAGDAGKTDWAFIPVENLEQIEVIKGASSVLYGSSALSGTINFRTTYPKEKQKTKARLYSGFYNEPQEETAKWWSGAANFSGLNFFHAQKLKSVDFMMGGQLLYDHNYIGPPIHDSLSSITLPDSIENNDVADRSGRFNFGIRYRPAKIEGLALGINGNIQQANTNFSLIWNNDSSGLYRAYPKTMTLTKSTAFYLDPYLTYFSKGGLKHDLRGRFFYTDNDNSNNQSNKTNVYYLEYQFGKQLSVLYNLRITGGVMMNRVYSSAPLYAGSGSGNNLLSNYSAYTQLDKKFWKVLNVSFGFRGEYFQINKTENVTRPIVRMGMSLKLARATFLRYSYGQGYRYPTITEKFIYTGVGGITIWPNPDIKPETSWNTEVGIKQGFKAGKFYGFLDIAAFWQEYGNTVEWIYALWGPDSAGFKFVNTGNSRVRGIEISLMGEGKIWKDLGVSLLGGYSYTLPQTADPDYVFATDNPGPDFIPTQLSYSNTSTDTTNNILKYRFQHLGKIDVEFSYKKVAMGFSVRYYSFMQNIDMTFYTLDSTKVLQTGIRKYREENNSGTTVLDMRISTRIGKYYKAALILNNVANLEYALRPLKIESPRTLAVQLSAEF
jgi:outer membrane receptor protein involved in Fe transport